MFPSVFYAIGMMVVPQHLKNLSANASHQLATAKSYAFSRRTVACQDPKKRYWVLALREGLVFSTVFTVTLKRLMHLSVCY